MNGTAAVGTSTDVSRSDHVHPIDTSRAASSHTHSYAATSHTHAYAATSHTHTVAQISNLNTTGALVFATLWTNPNPQVEFPKQTITVSNWSSYKLIYVEGTWQMSGTEKHNCIIIYNDGTLLTKMDGGTQEKQFILQVTGDNQTRWRLFYFVSNTQIYFDTGHRTSDSLVNSAQVMIPTKIVGIK